MDSTLQRVSSSLCRVSLMERAKEELEILEYQQPNKFNSLKRDLKALISEFDSQLNDSTTTCSADTQGHRLPLPTPPAFPSFSCTANVLIGLWFGSSESSSWKKRRKDDSLVGEETGKAEASAPEVCTYNSVSKRKCKTDVVLERAQKCLDKVRKYKSSFLQKADSLATT